MGKVREQTAITFESFYGETYGARWEKLKEALLEPENKPSFQYFAGMPAYKMDAASVVAALALEVKPFHTVLDMCAAPGGKTLVLLNRGVETLIANELSFSRRKRLEEVIRSGVPELERMKVRIRGIDAIQYGLREPNTYDRILLDAPCSSERHHLQNERNEWTLSKTKSLSQRQYGLACSALLALKPGGRMVYSTCSISPFENDRVIQRMLERKGDQVELVGEGTGENELSLDRLNYQLNELLPSNTKLENSLRVEKTQNGYQIFPDQPVVERESGAKLSPGPIYFSVLQKR